MRRALRALLGLTAVATLTAALALPHDFSPAEPVDLEAAEPAAATQEGGDQTGEIGNFWFRPAEFTVNVGDTITFTNNAPQPHTFTDRGGTFDTDAIAPGDTGSITFDVPGTYFFFCRINPGGMNGKVVVQGDTASLATNRVQATDDVNLEGEQFAYTPAELTVPSGSTIQFANVGGEPHTMTADDGSFDTGRVEPGAESGRFAGNTVAFAVGGPGEVTFHCEIHPEMTGTLTIVEGEETAQPAPQQPPPETPAELPTAPDSAEVQMADFSFDPPEVSVTPGGTITWTNGGEAPHAPALDDQQLDDAQKAALRTGNVAPGEQGSLTVPELSGSYSYLCELHPDRMRGVLVVVGEGIPDPTQQQASAPVLQEASPAAAPAEPPADDGDSDGVSLFVLFTAALGAFAVGLALASLIAWRSRTPRPF